MKKIEVKLQGNKYKFPISLMQVDYKVGKRLLEIVNMDYGDNKLKQVMIISTLLGIKPKVMLDANIDADILLGVYNLCMDVINECKTPIFKQISVDNSYYILKDLDNISTRDYCDIDFILNEQKNMIETSSQIMQIMYSKAVPYKLRMPKKVYKSFKAYLKPVLRTPKKNGVIVPLDCSKLPVGYVTAFLSYIMEFKSVINKKYPSIFSIVEDDSDKPFGYTKPVDEVWGWYATINNLCNDDKRLVDYWLDKPFKEFLKFVSFKVQKNTEELAKLKNKK